MSFLPKFLGPFHLCWNCRVEIFRRRIKISVSVNLSDITKIPHRTLPVADIPTVITHRTPPHDSVAFRIEICFDNSGAWFTTGTAATTDLVFGERYSFRPRCHGYDRNDMLSQFPGGAFGSSDISVFIKKMLQADYPGITHIRSPARLNCNSVLQGNIFTASNKI